MLFRSIWDEALLTPEAAQIEPQFSMGGTQSDDGPLAEQMQGLADAARRPGNLNQTVDLGSVSAAHLAQLQAAGLNIDHRYHHTADMFAVRHALNRHSDAKVEKSRAQLPITDADVRAAQEVVQTPDAWVLGGKTPRRQEVLGSIKRMHDGTLLYIEEQRTGAKTLAMTSMRKYPGTSDFQTIANSLLPTNARSDAGDVRIIRPAKAGSQEFYDAAGVEIENGPVLSGLKGEGQGQHPLPTGTEPSPQTVAALAAAVNVPQIGRAHV